MKINTLQFGEIEYSSDNIISFSPGIIGFENLKDFLFIKQDNEFFYWINSLEDSKLAFPLFPIRLLEEDFPCDPLFEPFGIVNLNKDPLKVTVNLKAPVFIDQENRRGSQKIIDLDKYSVNYHLFKE